MSSIKIKVKSWDSAGNVVPKTQTVELNKDTAFNLQGDGYFLPNFIGKIIKRGEEYILINEEDSTNIQEYTFLTQGGDFPDTVQNLYGSNLNFWESEESFPEADAPVTLPPPNRAGESKQPPAVADAGGWGFLTGGRKKKKRKRRRKKSTKRRRRKKSTKRRRRKKSTKRRRRKKKNA